MEISQALRPLEVFENRHVPVYYALIRIFQQLALRRHFYGCPDTRCLYYWSLSSNSHLKALY